MGNIVDKAKKIAQGFMKLVNKIIKMVKFFMTQIRNDCRYTYFGGIFDFGDGCVNTSRRTCLG